MMGLSRWNRDWVCFTVLIMSVVPVSCALLTGKITPGFRASQMGSIDTGGIFLVSGNGNFGFGFTSVQDSQNYLVVVHMGGDAVVWSANRGSPVAGSDLFVFDDTGNAFLEKGGGVLWSTGTGNMSVSEMQLQDSGNLALVGNDSSVIWQSFSHPTDTILSNQEFRQGMSLVSSPGSQNWSYVLEIKSGDMILSVNYSDPQAYWSMGTDSGRIINQAGGPVVSASLVANTWRFYDKDKNFLWQYIFVDSADLNTTWAAILGNDGIISFSSLGLNGAQDTSSTKIPSDACSTPEPCAPYQICDNSNRCQCPPSLIPYQNCIRGVTSPCNNSQGAVDLVSTGVGIGYFALRFTSPSMKSDLIGCKTSCLGNCSCLAMFFQNSSGDCYLFDSVGAFQTSSNSQYVSYIKVLTGQGNTGSDPGSNSNGNNVHVALIVAIGVSTLLIIIGLLCVGYRRYKRSKQFLEYPQETSEEENFLENLSGMPVRFTYQDLQIATNNFSMKLGQGGFGSVYQGILPDGTRLAVKKLEGIGQGKKEFRAEVCIIGSIHHHHLVRLKGFCAEGSHRLLAYEYMAKGSLDKWIFTRNNEQVLDWKMRYNIAIGTAKGLAYLHEDCDVKIVHCDIKPENVLLDDNFLAKVSDFGLAKLMTREQSLVFTTLRGTRGYLAPEWITNYAISEKSDVYSYGMVLLEIISGRHNYNPGETSLKSHFPSYAFKMMEEGRLMELLDSKIETQETDETVLAAIKVALWCIQEDMNLRPSMTKVVQMLEGITPVAMPPASSPLVSRLHANYISTSEEAGTTSTSSGPSEAYSDANMSAVRLSGPR
ncbi:hypothetical protein MLD38_014599 [Melastoma candidum]|uniref:Uncharacterized protein n=1 Tax=Melastoma candidum TaxID=119954 RepID=A0ACB9RCN4_9MYRT|nr:hypothetical protein MLD38_014599 [Melastoma candidum]